MARPVRRIRRSRRSPCRVAHRGDVGQRPGHHLHTEHEFACRCRNRILLLHLHRFGLQVEEGALAVAVDSAVRIVRVGTTKSRASALVKGAIAAAPVLLFLIGGGLLTAELAAGLYWIAAGIATAFIVSVLNAWVLLVEILR